MAITGLQRDSNRALVDAALLGTAAGMRAVLPLSAWSLKRSNRRALRIPVAIASLSELTYDKQSWAASRTVGPPLFARLGSGALLGVLSARRFGASPWLGAATGAVAALVGTFLFHRLRIEAAKRVPPVAAALGEDLLAAGLSAAAVRTL